MRKAVSPVIATILLILIAIAAGVIIYSYIIDPLVPYPEQREQICGTITSYRHLGATGFLPERTKIAFTQQEITVRGHWDLETSGSVCLSLVREKSAIWTLEAIQYE